MIEGRLWPTVNYLNHSAKYEEHPMMKRNLPSALATACLLAISVPAFAQDWTRFRGPNGTGLSEASDIPVKWTDKDYNWKTDFPGVGHSQPVAWGEKIFLGRATIYLFTNNH